ECVFFHVLSLLCATTPLRASPERRRQVELPGGNLLLLTWHESGRTTPRGLAPSDRALETVGPLPERTRVGDRSRGLQRARQRMGVLPPRSRPVARLPVERGRHCGHL